MNATDIIEHYRHFNRVYPNDIHFFNHGYYPTEPDFESDFYNASQLTFYHHLVKDIKTKGLKILDIGCGRGGGPDLFQNYSYDFDEVHGIDISPENIEFAKKNVSGVHFNVMDACNLLYGNNYFDIITCAESSHCYHDMSAFLQEVRRVLKPDGTFILTDNNLSLEKYIDMRECQYRYILREDITENVMKASQNDMEKFSTIQDEKIKGILLLIAQKSSFNYQTRFYNYIKYTCSNSRSIYKDNNND